MHLLFITLKKNYEKLLLGGILLLSTLLEALLIGKNGNGNNYYAAAVKSMLQSWHNFFYVSFDPSGFISVDKPPIALWFQTLSAKIFGFHGWTLLFPQAAAHILSVWVLYQVVKRTSGSLSGLLAAFILAVTPINVVVGSTNEVDSILVFFLLVAAWFLFTALESKKLYSLLLSFLFIGIGFNTKMLQAYLVLPAFLLTYFLCTPITRLKRISNLTVAIYFLLIVSLSWATLVDLTPKQNRPYVGSSDTNSALHLALGYNGIQRITGNMFEFGGKKQNATFPLSSSPKKSPTTQSIQWTSGGNDGSMFVGTASLYRFFDQDFGGQIGWLVPFAAVSLFALLVKKKFSFPSNDSEQWATIFWGTWFVTCVGVFSIAGFIHPYYTVMLGPAIAALASIGSRALWKIFYFSDWRIWLLPVALGVTVIGQITILSLYKPFGFLIPILLALGITGITLLISTKSSFQNHLPYFSKAIYGLFITMLLVTSLIWIGYSLTHMVNQTIPAAGPGNFGSNGNSGLGNNEINLIHYLEVHQGKAKYLVGTVSAPAASDIIIATGKAVMTWGGFSGSDRTITLSQFKQDVREGIIRYFYIQFSNRLRAPQIQNTNKPAIRNGFKTSGLGEDSSITQWIVQACSVVPISQWQSNSSRGFGLRYNLYDCR